MSEPRRRADDCHCWIAMGRRFYCLACYRRVLIDQLIARLDRELMGGA